MPDNPAQHTAILRRFRELLIQQQDRFHRYITALEKQQALIESGSTEELLAHVEREEHIAADILSIQKVIAPIEKMYQAALPFSSADDIPALKSELEKVKEQAAALSASNRELLSSRMAELRAQIGSLKSNPFINMSRSLYQNSIGASLVDMSG